jgi:hypothetical protein
MFDRAVGRLFIDYNDTLGFTCHVAGRCYFDTGFCFPLSYPRNSVEKTSDFVSWHKKWLHIFRYCRVSKKSRLNTPVKHREGEKYSWQFNLHLIRNNICNQTGGPLTASFALLNSWKEVICERSWSGEDFRFNLSTSGRRATQTAPVPASGWLLTNILLRWDKREASCAPNAHVERPPLLADFNQNWSMSTQLQTLNYILIAIGIF